MKNIKRIFLVLLTFVLSFSVISNVLADSTGSITINGTTRDKTYEIYKIFDLTYSGENVAYTIDSDWEEFFNNDGVSYIVDSNTGSLNQITIGSEIKYINITEDNIVDFTNDALKYASGLVGNDGSEIAASDSLKFTNLELGYYLVYPKGATDIIEGNSSICSITSTTPDALVNIKASYPVISKSVDDQNVFVGQLVEFTITGKVPSTVGYDTYTYEIKDTMSAGLEFNSDISNLVVKFGNDVIDVEPVYLDNGFTLTFDMTSYQEYAGEVITVVYNVKVTEEAVLSDTTKNSATLTYSNDPKDSESKLTTPPVEIPVYSSLINVIKVDAKNEDVKLAGASFVLTNKAGLYYQAIDSDGKVISLITNTDGIEEVRWVENEEDATTLVTDDTGIVTFKGIENGTYYLVEIEAPLGYNKLNKPVEIKVGYDENGTELVKYAVSHEEVVMNNSGLVLPTTGSIGTKIFIFTGLLLSSISGIVLLANKKNN